MKRYVNAYNYDVTSYDKKGTPLCILLEEQSIFNKHKNYNLTLDPNQPGKIDFNRLLELLKLNQRNHNKPIQNKELIRMLRMLKNQHKYLSSRLGSGLMIILLAFPASGVLTISKIFKVAMAQKMPTPSIENTNNNLPSQEELLSLIDDDVEDNLPIDDYQRYVWQLDGICNDNQNHPYNGEKEAIIYALIDELLSENTKEQLKLNGITNSNDIIDKIGSFMNRPSDNGEALPLSQLDVNELLEKLLLELEDIDNNFANDYRNTVERLTNFIIFIKNNQGQLTPGQMLILGKKVDLASGTVTLTIMMGSKSTGLASLKASLKASRPAISNAIGFESTGCSLPS
jgi:hypothetical protein